MEKSEVNRFNKLYEEHLRFLKLQGKAPKTIDAYLRAIRRVRDYFDCCPDRLNPEQLKIYFSDLVESHSWSIVKIDRLGLQFFWKYVLQIKWKWIDIVKPPKSKTITDVLTPCEIEKLISAIRKLRYYSGPQCQDSFSFNLSIIFHSCACSSLRITIRRKDLPMQLSEVEASP